MQYTLKSNSITVVVDDKGAEIQSIKSQNETEYIWTADGKYWARHAPNLFPIVGALNENRYEYKGKEYTMKQHGFARNSVFECVKQTDTRLEFLLHSTSETKECYPFDFNFYVLYALKDSALDITYKVENLTDGEMYFSVGAHPGFLCTGALKDYVIKFDPAESKACWQLNADGIINPADTICPFEDDGKTIKLTEDLFEDGVYIFKNIKSKSVSLENTKTNTSVKVDYKGFKYLGIWAPAGAPFVCLEPWFGLADTAGTSFDYSQKEGIEMLEKDGTFCCTHTISIK